jgi:putative ABC transport system permease protein
MFFTYLGRELRRRMRQVVFISLGLAVGIGLVITVTAASAGVAQAQGRVLHSLYGVGTDITVTKAPTASSGGPFGFRIRGATVPASGPPGPRRAPSSAGARSSTGRWAHSAPQRWPRSRGCTASPRRVVH